MQKKSVSQPIFIILVIILAAIIVALGCKVVKQRGEEQISSRYYAAYATELTH